MVCWYYDEDMTGGGQMCTVVLSTLNVCLDRKPICMNIDGKMLQMQNERKHLWEKCIGLVWLQSQFMTYNAASQQGTTEMCWLHL